jgi:hypothetical protein
VDQLSSSDFLRAKDKCDFIKALFQGPSFEQQMEAVFADVLAERVVLQKETRLHHQKKLSLDFCRNIDQLCQGYGDPIVILGAAGGNGGRGRSQINHNLLMDTLAGFFVVIHLDEYCTTKKTMCCHQDALAPKKGRSRGCNHCHPGKTAWWDRDVGSAW